MKRRALLAMVAAGLSAVACAGGYEQALLAQFFAASRMLDRTALQNISTVIFDPRTDGTVLRFDVDRISPEDHGEKRVAVTAVVHLPTGVTVPEALEVTLRRRDPTAGEGLTTGRWVVTGVAKTR